MDIRETAENARHHKEFKKEEPHDSERCGSVTSTANAQRSEVRVKSEHAVVTIESSEDEADEPDPSGTRNENTQLAMNTAQKAKKSHNHVELKVKEADDSERFGHVTSTAIVQPPDARVKREDEVVTIESSGDDADVSEPSGTWNVKTEANGTRQMGSTPCLQLATVTPNAKGLYVCRQNGCKKKFASRELLELHLEEPHSFACDLCKFKTTTRSWLKRHMERCVKKWLRRNAMEDQSLWGTKRKRKKQRRADAALLANLHTCWRCSTVFRDKRSLDEHVRESHGDPVRKVPTQINDVKQEPQANGSGPDVIFLD